MGKEMSETSNLLLHALEALAGGWSNPEKANVHDDRTSTAKAAEVATAMTDNGSDPVQAPMSNNKARAKV